MAENEGAIFGASGILGVNNLQRAIDSFDRTVQSLQTVVGKMGDFTTQYQAGRTATGSWNKLSNWAGGGNGGNPTFGGVPAGGGGSGSGSGGGGGGGTPAASGGAHRAPGPARLGWFPGGGAYRGQGNGQAKAAFAMGMASTAVSEINLATGQTRAASNADSMTYLTTAQSMSTGQTVNAPSMFRNGWGFMSGTDQAAANMAIWQGTGFTPNSGGFRQMQNWVNTQALANPMMSGSQAAKAVMDNYSVRGMIGLHRVGITTIKRGGQRQSPLNIANQILNQVDPQQTVRTKEDAAQLLNDPFSNLNMTLGNWVSNGIITGDQVQEVKDQIQMILKARQHGVGYNKLQALSNARKPGNAADKTLKSMHIGDSAMQKEKDLGSEQRQGTIQGLTGFNEGLKNSVDGLIKFKDALNNFMADTGLSDVSGRWRAATSHGKAGIATAIGHGFMSWLDNPISLGGSNESRMSVLSGAGGSATSGEPHHAGAASQGANIGGPGRGSGSGGGGSKGQRMQWPCRGPITAGFGQSGTHWSSGSHTGIDIGVGTGTPIHAAASGTVVFAGYNSAYGNEIQISHGGGVISLYGHNSRLVVHNGAQVRQGQLIAYSGATGNVTGPHCHFEIRKNGTPVNPMSYLNGSATVSGSGGGGSTSSVSSAASSGSGTTSDIGAGASYTMSTVGMSELDVLGAAAGATGYSGGNTAGSLSTGTVGSAGGSPGGSAQTVSPGTGSGVERYRPVVIDAMKRLGVKNPSKADVDRALMQMRTESGGNPTVVNKWDVNWKAGHPSVGLMQVIAGTFAEYAGPFRNTGPFEYGVSTNPEANIYAALNYARSRYGSWANAFHGHGYDKGAWDVPQDEIAKVHKREMIIPAKEADQIRQILVNGNPYGTQGNKATGSGVTLKFDEGAIKVTVAGGSSGTATGRAIGKAIVDTLATDKRITDLQRGV